MIVVNFDRERWEQACKDMPLMQLNDELQQVATLTQAFYDVISFLKLVAERQEVEEGDDTAALFATLISTHMTLRDQQVIAEDAFFTRLEDGASE